jgi:hypothetical protein
VSDTIFAQLGTNKFRYGTDELIFLQALLSLDKGVNFKQRKPTCVYVVSRFGVVLLAVASSVLIVCGFVTKETTVALTIPLLIVCLLHILFGLYVASVAIRFRRALPVDNRLPNGNGHVLRPPPYATSTLQSQQQRIGDESFSSLRRGTADLPMHVYRPPPTLRQSPDVQYSPDGKIYGTNSFGGSVQTVYTLASDV